MKIANNSANLPKKTKIAFSQFIKSLRLNRAQKNLMIQSLSIVTNKSCPLDRYGSFLAAHTFTDVAALME